MDTLSEKQRKTTPGITRDGKALYYRHPWVVGPDGKGIVRRVGCSTLDDNGKQLLMTEAVALLSSSQKSAPMRQSAVLSL